MSLPLALDLAQRAGERLLHYYGRLNRHHADLKKGYRRDLVSRADVEAEEIIISGLPIEDSVLAEESGRRETDSSRLWVVDPLDGTVNYLHQIPFWAVSIALVEDGKLAIGVIHAPALGMTFSASRGGGAHLLTEPIAVSDTALLGDAILASGFSYHRHELADHNLDNWRNLAFAAAGLRRFGSAALDLAFVAAGRFDGFWELHLNPWDVAAGALIVREAGGEVSTFTGAQSVDEVLHRRHLVASNGTLHGDLLGILQPLRELNLGEKP